MGVMITTDTITTTINKNTKNNDNDINRDSSNISNHHQP